MFQNNKKLPTNKARCQNCRKLYVKTDLIETINLTEATEYFCVPCLKAIDNQYKSERIGKAIRKTYR